MQPRAWKRTGSAAALLAALAGRSMAAESGVGTWGPLAVAGELSASMAPKDPAFFNDTGYRGNPLRTMSMELDASLRLAERVALLTEIRADDFKTPSLYALYLRLRPFTGRSFDVQIGRIPPVFGSYLRRSYGSGNPLIGKPLAYQYLTTLRPDSLPSNAEDLLRIRGRGWRVRYPNGLPQGAPGAPGLPLVQGLRWDTGIEARVGREPLQLAVAVTQGTLCNPQLDDDNDGKSVSARLGWTPATGFVLGASVARGEYATAQVTAALPPGIPRSLSQRAIGVDAEYSRGHAIARLEWVGSAWDVPVLGSPVIDSPLHASALSLEGVYRIAPGLDAAVRADALSLSEVQGETLRDSWDAPVTRVEVGLSYAVRRKLIVKAAYQRNWRDVGPPGRKGFPAGQVSWRF